MAKWYRVLCLSHRWFWVWALVQTFTNAYRHVCKYIDQKGLAAMMTSIQSAGKSEDHTSEKTHKKGPTLALKSMAEITRNPKQGYQWPHEKDLCPSNFFEKRRWSQEIMKSISKINLAVGIFNTCVLLRMQVIPKHSQKCVFDFSKTNFKFSVFFNPVSLFFGRLGWNNLCL